MPPQKKDKAIMSDQQRMLDLINFANPFSFGSLWWIRDSVWKSVNKKFVISSAAKKHPACCLGKRSFQSLGQHVPMLLGSHSNHTGFIVSDLTETSKKTKDYGFFALRPYRIPVRHAIGSDPDIERNAFKTSLSDYEKLSLKAYLKPMGISYDESNESK